MERIEKLPLGVYAVSEAFVGQVGEVIFCFRGRSYQGEVGVNAFGTMEEMAGVEKQAPEQTFEGTAYDVPVVLVPAGVYHFGKVLRSVQNQAITILGEQMGVSPNGETCVSEPNPQRNREESVLEGSFYYGALGIAQGVEGYLTLDGLTLRNTRIRDYRTDGQNLGITLRNCIFEGSNTTTLVEAWPLTSSESTRSIRIENCRLDGMDAMDGDGCMVRGCASDLRIERLYFANTKKIFGITSYSRDVMNCPPRGVCNIEIQDSVFEKCESIHGLSFRFPEDIRCAKIHIKGCRFSGFSPEKDPAIWLNLPNEACTLMVENTQFVGTDHSVPAILVRGNREASVVLTNSEQKGYQSLWGYQPPRRREAPDQIGNVVWTEDRLEDPHIALGSGDFAQLNALYAGKKPYHGDLHTHTDSGGTSDGKTPLGTFVKQLKALNLDFAAVVDHRQMRHFYLPEWDESMLIYGTEPGTRIIEPERDLKACSMHYTMLFQHASDLARVMEAFPEYEFTGGPDGHFKYPTFTPERMAELARFVRGLGGVFTHAHPKQLMCSENPLDYYFTDDVFLETVMTSTDGYDTVQNLKLWEQLLKLGKKVRTFGSSDTHGNAKNCALTTVYARERNGAAILREVREGDCAAGFVGIKMAISGARMGSSLPYRDGMTLTVQLDDFYEAAYLPDTVYCLKVYTDRGLAYASEFNGKMPQALVLPVYKRKYYRVEVTNESDGCVIGISNPIWLD